MTQEELDSLTDSIGFDEDLNSEEEDREGQAYTKEFGGSDFKIDHQALWPPPPPNQEHKVVHQLDDVTKDSEKKATELLEKLENISECLGDSENTARELAKVFDKNIELFTKLNEKFPNVKSFAELLELNQGTTGKIKDILEKLQSGQDEVMIAMDAMQYQDIHRQKIERVINVMRALSRYMSSLFEARIDDRKRTSSAVHIEGDSTSDVVSNDDIEALIASLGNK